MKGARFVNSSMFFLREEKTFASTEGSFTVQTIYRTQPTMTVTAVGQRRLRRRASRTTSRRAASATSTCATRSSSRTRRNGPTKRCRSFGEVGRRRPLRPRAASVAPLAHDPRIGRASDRARSRDGLRGELRRHELRRAAGEGARHAQVRLRAHEHSRRSHAGRIAVARAVGTTKA